MAVTYSSVVDAPRDDVFAWHTRPGAFHRLSPPWSPMRLISEATSLEDGRAILALPGGLRWVAQHQADCYDPPRRFVDAIGSAGPASLPARIAVRWRHIHDFEDTGDGRTRVIDRVETPVPADGATPDVRLPAPAVGRRSGRAPVGGRAGLDPRDRRDHRVVGTRRLGAVRVSEHRRPSRHSLGARHRAAMASGSGNRTTRTRISSPGSTQSSIWPAPRSPADSPTATEKQSATAASAPLAGWPKSRHAAVPR